MKSIKLLLFMQFIALVPAVLFISLYMGISFTSFVLLILLFLLMGWSMYRYKQQKSFIHYPLLFTIIMSFFIYGLHALGSMQAPQTFTLLKAEESVTLLTLNKPSAIDKVCYYVGIDYDSFTLEYETKAQWKTFYTYKKDYPYSFSWKCQDIALAHVQKIIVRATENEKLVWSTDNQLMLGEIRFSYQGKPIRYTTDKSQLNDETDIPITQGYYGGMFFDEIYHGRTAYEIIHHLEIYENTHPYLGKHIIIQGIKLFGMTPFGWRFSNIFFAALMVFILYYFALQLFREHLFAFAAALLMTYSFMHLAQARIGLIDTFGVTFTLISYHYLYRFIREQTLALLLWSGVFFGLAISIKWSAVFASLGFMFIALYLLLSHYPLQKRFRGWGLIKYGLLSYGVLALGIYGLSFFDIYMRTGSLQSIIDYNTNMYHYHSTLIATHPYSSPWWSWPLDWKPMGYYKEDHEGLTRSINAFGNPAIFWTGIIALLYTLYQALRYKSLEAMFILLAFIGLYIPYVFIGRLMFIYHFYYAVPFLMLAIVYMLQDSMMKFATLKYLYMVYFCVVIGLFLLYYPLLSGVEISRVFVNQYLLWLPKWWM